MLPSRQMMPAGKAWTRVSGGGSARRGVSVTTAVQTAGGVGGGPSPPGLADVIDTILGEGLVIEAYIRDLAGRHRTPHHRRERRHRERGHLPAVRRSSDPARYLPGQRRAHRTGRRRPLPEVRLIYRCRQAPKGPAASRVPAGTCVVRPTGFACVTGRADVPARSRVMVHGRKLHLMPPKPGRPGKSAWPRRRGMRLAQLGEHRIGDHCAATPCLLMTNRPDPVRTGRQERRPARSSARHEGRT